MCASGSRTPGEEGWTDISIPLRSGMVHWPLEYLLPGEILHLTGIAAALSESCHDLIERFLTAANERGVTVSFDVNVRRLLFEGRDPRKILGPLAARADLLLLSDDEVELLFSGSDPGSLQEARRDIQAEAVVAHRASSAREGRRWNLTGP